MDENEIRKYAKLMKELGLTGLEITSEGSKVRLERSAAPTATVPGYADVSPLPRPSDTPAPEREPEDTLVVRSPMVGVFYAGPAENADPYVRVGGRVEKGQTLCVIEAMKLMNEITAEEAGVITAICATNGQVVEYGTELFRLRRLEDE